MTSKILNDALLANIDVNFPVANKNNSTSGFRENFRQTRDIIQVAAQEISALQDKKIEIVGDATGISGALGSTTAQPAAINLILSASGVTAGTYTSTHNELTLSVDSKGRIISFTSVPTPLRPAVAAEFKFDATSTTTTGNVKEATSPVLTFDQYGTLTLASTNTLKFGLTGHSLAKGSLLVGMGTAGEATEFVVPNVSYNPNDVWALAWRADVANEYALAWYKLPAPTPVNPAQVINILPGVGIQVSTDPAQPVVGFDFTTFSNYPDTSSIQTGTKMLMWDPATNNPYQVDISKIFTVAPGSGLTPLYTVHDDTAPTLGGALNLGVWPIKSTNTTYGVQLETIDQGPFVLRNTKTINQNTGLPLDPTQYVVSTQKFPATAPSFTSAETAAGVTVATLKSTASGQMYWDKTQTSGGGITSLTAGVGIGFDPLGNINTSGTIQLDLSTVPQDPAIDIYSDFAIAGTPGRDHLRAPIAELTYTMRKVFAVDPVDGADNIIIGRGQLHRPFRTIAAAIDAIEQGNPDSSFIYLFPGTYEENFDINKPNVNIVSVMGPEMTKIRGGFTIAAGMGNVSVKGLSFDMTNIFVNPPERLLTASDGLESLRIEACWFYREFTEQGRPQEIISLSGAQTGNVVFDRCKFNGKFMNYLQFDNDNGFTDGRVRILNTDGDLENLLYVTTSALTQTEVSNCDLLGQLTHLGGILDVKNIGAIWGDFNDALWASADDSDDLDSLGYIREGIQSTATSTVTNNNFLSLTNVCLRYYLDHIYFVTSSIQKSGSCQWTMANVQRKPDIDLLNGLRFDNHSVPKTDISDQVKHFPTTSGAVLIDTRMSSTWSYELTGDTQFTFKSFETSPNVYADVNQSVSFRVSIKQDTTARAVTWAADTGSIIWDGGIAPTSVSLTTGGYGVYEFIRINANWFAKRILAS